MWKDLQNWALVQTPKGVRWGLLAFVSIAVCLQLFLTISVSHSGVISSFRLGDGRQGALSIDELLELPLLERLRLAFPYDGGEGGIEKNVIQTSQKKEFTNKEVEIWKSTPGFNHTMYDDQMAFRMMLREFGPAFPEIVEAYERFPRKILQVDFFRYVAVFTRGGTYTDTDTLSVRPLPDWITYNDTIFGRKNTVGAVAGVEIECDCDKWPGISSRRVQLCQWTLQAKKHHPLYAQLIANVIDIMTNHYDKNKKIATINGKDYDFNRDSATWYDGIMELTGPGMFTHSVFQYINTLDVVSVTTPNNYEEIFAALKHPSPSDTTISMRDPRWPKFGWENVTNIVDPVLVNDDILILPRLYFNGKKDENPDVCLVQHNYHGSWKGSGKGILDN